MQNFKRIFIFVFFIFISCQREKSFDIPENSIIENFKLNNVKNNQKKWMIFCKKAFLDEKNNTVKCFENVFIEIYSENKKTTELYSKSSFGDFKKNMFYLENNVRVFSFIENLELYIDKLNFDINSEKIYSKSKTRVINKKENVYIYSYGFESKTDLSNIKFYKHTTRKI